MKERGLENAKRLAAEKDMIDIEKSILKIQQEMSTHPDPGHLHVEDITKGRFSIGEDLVLIKDVALQSELLNRRWSTMSNRRKRY